MSKDSFGSLFRVTTYGESHGPGLGGIIQGCPPGIALSEDIIQRELDKRKPGQGAASTRRKEADLVQILSGVFEGRTTGTAIGFHIANQDQRSRDYSGIKDIYRPGHGDITYEAKYGIRDYRGGGRSSGRETVSRVAAGAVAQEFLRTLGIRVLAYTAELGGIPARVQDMAGAQKRPFFSPDPEVVSIWEELVQEVKSQGDSLGGIVEIRAENVPAGLGEPVFDKLDARLAYALMGVGAVKGVEIGAGFAASRMRGSENNDQMGPDGFLSNHAGGVLAGITSGQPLVVRAGVKPIPSIAITQKTMTRQGTQTRVNIGGRHDISAIPRIVPVLKSMVMLVLADMVLLQRAVKTTENR
ncbi:chorismate synthase [Desulfonatronospira sp. MSAO_Bac3]|uniref:chorismate synthase n=1 Tax=Desulfonatronospira sp. MSAO_Bac3 TaxID=2293857 RepID=UPI000FEEE44B|nr:chorismate synthase [Desulfonatronospira sp. MSAO_Bac3]RQD78691.1 MAG: chorismate synthase [Desulfonatronospira sp. MSAO_Bac3]